MASTPRAGQGSEPRSLYLRHRPRSFGELVGHDPLVRLLRRSLQADSAHHAYLFAGARGSGKTSTARLVAAAVNCERAPCADPCGRCESCVAIASGHALDVLEIDSAAHSSVEDARALREQAALLPMQGRFRVYILDEAHMLSRSAWNALLKTLEEPPPHAIFVLCTTEPHKVPATVADRCHRFHFRAPSAGAVEELLARVASAEQLVLAEDARALLARAAQGSFRDALCLLDQATSYAEGEVTAAIVQTIAGLAEPSSVDAILDALADGDERALASLTRSLEEGQEPTILLGALEARLRELLVVQTLRRVPANLSHGRTADEALRAQAKRLRRATVSHALDLIAGAREAVRCGADARTQLEHAIVKAANPGMYEAVEKLLARIERLERSRAATRG